MSVDDPIHNLSHERKQNDLRLFQNQVHRGGHGVVFAMILSGLRRAIAASAAQAGDGDWIRNSLPSELRSSLFIGYGRYDELSMRTTGTFLFGGISSENNSEPSVRQTKTFSSASSLPAGRQGRLCGENDLSYFAKYDI